MEVAGSMKATFLLTLGLCAGGIATAVHAQTYFGQATAIDGDSLRIGLAEFRLLGIDAPEYRQTCKRGDEVWNCGEQARIVMDGLIAGKSITCQRRGVDPYGRIVATCKAGATDLAAALARSGFAVALPQFSTAYVASAEQAKSERLGIWSGEFQMPAEFRATDPDFQRYDEQARRDWDKRQAEEPPPVRRDVYYRNCAEARRAGAAPIYRGQPGYRPEMDGDGDGIACEPYRGK